MYMTLDQYNEIICTNSFRQLIESMADEIWENFEMTGSIDILIDSMTHSVPFHYLRECGVDQGNPAEIQEFCEYIANEGF